MYRDLSLLVILEFLPNQWVQRGLRGGEGGSPLQYAAKPPLSLAVSWLLVAKFELSSKLARKEFFFFEPKPWVFEYFH